MDSKKDLAVEPTVSPYSLHNLYSKLYNYFGGDKKKITLFTLVILLVSEIPLYFFTLLDVLKLESLFKYRLHYLNDYVMHLGIRNYPPNDVLWRTYKRGEFVFLVSTFLPMLVGLKASTQMGVYLFDTDLYKENEKKEGLKENEEEKKVNVTYWRVFKETVTMLFFADVLVYGLHRLFHTKDLYQTVDHKYHHEFKYSTAFVFHWLSLKEAFLLLPAQGSLPLICWAIYRKRPHILSQWLTVLSIAFAAALGHAGYRLPESNLLKYLFKLLLIEPPEFHDFHHVDVDVNLGVFGIADRIFGTFFSPGLEKDMNKVRQLKPMSSKVFG